MTERRQKIRGTTTQLDQVIGVEGLLAYDTTLKELRVYDGILLGGYRVPNLPTIDAAYKLPDRLTIGGKSLVGVSANTALENGFYYTSATTTDLPVADNGSLEVIRATAAGSLIQVWTRFNSTNDQYKRNYSVGGATWTAWTRIADLNYINTDAAVSAYSATRLNGQLESFYRNASNINAGTLADARLPGTMSGKTFTNNSVVLSLQTAANAVEHLRLVPTDWGAGKPGLFFNRTTQTKYTISLYDGAGNAGTIDFAANTSLTWNNNRIVTIAGDTFTGNVTVPNLYATGGNIFIRADSNRHLWYQTLAGITRGLLYHENSDGSMRLQAYDSAGVFQHALMVREDGIVRMTGSRLEINYDGNATSSELRLYADANSAYRMIGLDNNELYIQRSVDNGANWTSLVKWEADNDALFPAAVYAETRFELVSAYGANYLGEGSGDNATYASHNLRLGTWWGLGIYDTSSSTCRVVIDARGGHITHTGNLACGGVVYAGGGTAALYTDGNIEFSGGMESGYGTNLSTALNAAMWKTQTWQNVAASRAAGTSYQNTTGRPIMVSIRAADSSSFEVSSDNSTWLSIGSADGDTDAGVTHTAGVIIPPNWYYRCTVGFSMWSELR